MSPLLNTTARPIKKQAPAVKSRYLTIGRSKALRRGQWFLNTVASQKRLNQSTKKPSAGKNGVPASPPSTPDAHSRTAAGTTDQPVSHEKASETAQRA